MAKKISKPKDVSAAVAALKEDGEVPALAAPSTPPTKAPQAPKAGGRHGVARHTQGRAYFAGLVLAQFGLEVGITEEMVKACDAAYGIANPAESEGRLRAAYHAVRGYTEQLATLAKAGS